MKRYFQRPNSDYSGIRDEIIRCYQETGSTAIVAQHLHIPKTAVWKICKEEGILLIERKGRRTVQDFASTSCLHCRHFSRSSTTEGYCLSHRRSVTATGVEHCFTK